MRKTFRSLICIPLCMLLLISACFADTLAYSFSEQTGQVRNAFCSVYGWDASKMDSLQWQENGQEYKRSIGFQGQYLEELITQTELEAANLGILFTGFDGIGSDITEVALAEVGTKESPPGSNHVKYNTWFYGSDVCDPIENGVYVTKYAWCVVFLCWCAEQCGYLAQGIFTKTGTVRTEFMYMAQKEKNTVFEFKDSKAFGGTEEVSKGDILFWQSNGLYSHVGIITGVKDDRIEVVSGNMADAVTLSTLTKESVQRDPYLYGAKVVHVKYPNAQDLIFEFLTEVLQLNTAAACGLMANIRAESNFNTNSIGDFNFLKEDGSIAYPGYELGEATSYGLCQWHSENWTRLKNYCQRNGYDYRSYEGQLMFLKYELIDQPERISSEETLIERLRSLEDTPEGAYEAGYLFCKYYERPANTHRQGVSRGTEARERFYKEYAEETI